jgi:hypothetical protein
MRGRWLLLGWLWGLILPGPALAQHAHQSQTLIAGSTRSSLSLQVAALGESRLTLQFELPLAVAEARLTDPAGQMLRLRPGAELQLIDAAQRQQKGRGHLLVLKQPVIDPAPGRWRLDVDHAAARGREQLQLLVSQFPRFDLRLSLVGTDPASGTLPRVGAGSEPVLELRASDQGRPLTVQAQASALHVGSGQRTPLAFWHERPAGYDMPLQAEPGQAFAAWSPLAAGRYRIDVQQDVVGRDGQARALQRQLEVTVAPQPVWQQLDVLQTSGPQGCVAQVLLQADWQAQRPGRYAMTVVLEGRQRTAQGQVGVTVERPGPIRLQLALAARELLPLGDAPTVRRADLLVLADAGFELLQRRRGLPLVPPVAAARLCP